MEKPADLTAHNHSQFQAMVDLLQAERPVRAIAVFDHSSFRDELLDSTIGLRADLQPVLLDLSKTQVHSLYASMEEKVPTEFQDSETPSALIHIANLEGSLLGEALNGEPLLLADLATAGPRLAESFPGLHTICWIDRYLYERLQAEAPGFLAAADGVYHFYSPRQHQTEASPYTQMTTFAAALQNETEPEVLAPVYAGIGRIMEKAYRSPEANLYYEKALEAGTLAGNEKVLADVHLGFANLLFAEQDYAQALEQYEVALEKYQALADEPSEAEIHNQLARILGQGNNYNAAIKHQKRAFDYFVQSDDQREAGLSAKRLAYFYERKGLLDAAASTYGQAGDIYAGIDDAYEVALCHQQRAAILQNQRNLSEALPAFEQALAAAERSGNEYLIAALEDSVEELQEKLSKKPGSDSPKTKPTESSDDSGRRGFFRKLFGN